VKYNSEAGFERLETSIIISCKTVLETYADMPHLSYQRERITRITQIKIQSNVSQSAYTESQPKTLNSKQNRCRSAVGKTP
jgi:hypothetical protein